MKPLAAAALAAICATAAAGEPDSEAAVRARIEQVRAIAERIVIDGDGRDWAGIPHFAGSAGRTDDPSRHIVEVSIAPRRDDLLVMLRTAGRPSREDRAFWVNVDFMGAASYDFQVGIRDREPHVFWTFAEGETARAGSITGIEAAIGEVVEIRIPHSALARALPAAMAEQLRGPSARSWVRVAPFTWEARTRSFVNWGAAVASFRLSLGEAPLDPPSPRAMASARAIALPLKGQWRVSQGAFGIWTHQGAWAYDIDKVDATVHPSRDRDSTDPANYFGWDQPVVSPASGRVIRTRSSALDHAAREATKTTDPPNEVYLDLGDNIGLWFAHFRQGSSSHPAGSTMSAGQVMGRIGNSGFTSYPHLHVGLWRLPEGRETLPMAFSRVRVGLNPGPVDPWARALERWDIREGFIVENLTAFP